MVLKAAEVSVGDNHSETLVQDLKRTQLVQYAGASGDYNPLHTDEPYAREVAGYPGVFAHGMLTMGMTGAMLSRYVGVGRLVKFGVRFSAQVWPGDDLHATATVVGLRDEDGLRLVDLRVSTTNQTGAEVLSGYASARIDP